MGKSLRVVIWLLCGLALVILAGQVTVTVAGSRTCSACHSAAPRAEHASVDCLSCHAPSIGDRVAFGHLEYWRMVPRQIAGAKSGPSRMRVSRKACVDCHDQVLKPGRSSGRSGVAIRHEVCAASGACQSCHAAVAHGGRTDWAGESVMEDCTSCHVSSGASVACDSCHKGKLVTERLKRGPWQVTHGPRWRSAHGMGDLKACATCHESAYCARCHGVAVPHPDDFGGAHGDTAKADRDSCMRCHRQEAFCDSCHGVPMPHPAGFLKRHSSSASRVDDPKCARCHLEGDCVACHQRHIHPGNAAQAAGASKALGGGR